MVCLFLGNNAALAQFNHPSQQPFPPAPSQPSNSLPMPSDSQVIRQPAELDAARLGSPVQRVAFLQEDDSAEDSKKPEEATDGEPLLNAEKLTNAEAVSSALEKVQAIPDLSEEDRERLTKPLTSALQFWKQRQKDAADSASIEKSLESASSNTAQARYEVNRDDAEEVKLQVQPFRTLDQLLTGKSEQDSIVGEARRKLQQINDEISRRQPRRTELPKLIADAKESLETLRAQPVPEAVDDEDGQVTEARKALRSAELAATEQSVKTLENELRMIEAETELLPLRKTLAERELNRETELLQLWEDEVRSSKEREVREQLQSYRRELTEGAKDEKDPAKQSPILNAEDDWYSLLRQQGDAKRRLAFESSRTEELKRILREKKDIIEADRRVRRGIRSSLGIELQLLQSQLPRASNLTKEINRIGAEIDRLQSTRTEMQINVDWSSNNLNAPSWKSGVEVETELPSTEQRLTQQYLLDLDGYITTLVQLQTELTTQKETLTDLQSLIDRHVVWIRNRRPFGRTELLSTWPNVVAILHPSGLWATFKSGCQGLLAEPQLLALLAIVLGLMILVGSRLRRRMDDLASQARTRSTTTMKPTWSAMILTTALALPLFVLLYLVGEAIDAARSKDLLVNAYGLGFKTAAYSIFPLEMMRQILRPNGLAAAHFSADPTSVAQLRKGLRVLIDLGTPLLVLWKVCESLNDPTIESSLSRVIYVLGMISVATFFWLSLHPKTGAPRKQLLRHPDGWLSRLRGVWFPLIVLSPLALACLSLFGYQYASHALAERTYGTCWLVVGTYVASGVLWRWLVMQRRRVVFALHREKMQEADRTVVEGFEIDNDASLAADEINAQTSRLFRTTIFTTAIIGLALVWSPVLPAVQVLNLVELWEVETLDEKGNLTKQAITLANLVGALPILVLTWAAVRNLPGLVEGFLLERLPIDKASRYAITTLGTYVLAGLGIVWSAKALGLQWNSIQWLVAALGVGLGFGLQEIFANFMSGLILLFEQPIRVGDIITLDDTTGVVSRIRIRATTVTNWDRQELVVPNKDLITGRLINWTLTDSTNRVVIKVGVAYGSDTKRACELLDEICSENTNVLEDPAPLITFEGFGDSTLDLVLRCYLASLDNRLSTIHSLHTEINARFAEAGLEIAFPQRDLHIRSLPPGINRLDGKTDAA